MNGIALRAGTAATAVALTAALAACGGGGAASTTPVTGAPASAPTTSSSLVPVRWWSNSASTIGSRIDPENPDSAAAHLTTSPRDYCGMLRQTLAAGRSILPNVTANDPALLTSTKAFIAEIEAVAPSRVAGAWKVLGSAVLAFVGSGGDTTKVHGIDAAAVRKAASTVAADAKHSCDVDLS